MAYNQTPLRYRRPKSADVKDTSFMGLSLKLLLETKRHSRVINPNPSLEAVCVKVIHKSW